MHVHMSVSEREGWGGNEVALGHAMSNFSLHTNFLLFLYMPFDLMCLEDQICFSSEIMSGIFAQEF